MLKKYLHRIKTLDQKYLIAGGAGVVVVVVILLSVGHNGSKNTEVLGVERRDLVEEVRVAGTVEADIVADIGFETSGKVASVTVKEGDAVSAGYPLLSLSLGTLPAELESAQAEVIIKSAASKNTQTNLDAVTKEQDALVASAYRALLSDDLIFVPISRYNTVTPPTISGAYTGTEGNYRVTIKESTSIGQYDMYTNDLEKTGPIRIQNNTSAPLGTKGLFVDFPLAVKNYKDTVWNIPIPNKESASYTDNYNAYQNALSAREVAIENAKAELNADSLSGSIAEAELLKARAEIKRIESLISQRTLFAPFAGVVTEIHADPGEIVSANTVALSLISAGKLGVEIDLPEVDSIKVSVGDPALVQLDAFPDETFSATVVSVNRSETIVDGVPVYEARLSFDADDPRIQSGMTADTTITTNTKEGALAVPLRAISYNTQGEPEVVVRTDNGDETRAVVLGIYSTDGYAEIREGLSEGEKVIVKQ